MDNRFLIASEGMLLTNGETYASKVQLSDWDSPNNWREISNKEYEAIIEALMGVTSNE